VCVHQPDLCCDFPVRRSTQHLFEGNVSQDHHRIYQKKSAWNHKSYLLLVYSMNQTQKPSSCAPSNRQCTHPVKLTFFPESVLKVNINKSNQHTFDGVYRCASALSDLDATKFVIFFFWLEKATHWSTFKLRTQILSLCRLRH
jgi:hypothetical protein